MYKFCNLPKKGEKEIEGVINSAGQYQVQTEEGWIICTIEKGNDARIASDIADAIRFARDAGYRQALESIRRVLEIDT